MEVDRLSVSEKAAVRPRHPVRPEAHLSQPAREALVALPLLLGAIGVAALWWAGRDSTWDSSPGDMLTTAGRLAGLEGTYLVLVEVLLMARVPWIDRIVGMDRLAVWHRRNGQLVVELLVGHAFLILWGYALVGHQNVLSQARDLALSYPDVLAATVGLGLLVMVGVVSARAVRRRVRYHTWYFLHLYTYLAIALSFAHQLANGADLAANRLHRAAWVGLYLIVGGLLMTFRVAVPVRDALRHRLVVSAVVPESPGVVSIHLSGRRLGELRAEAGQFFIWRFLTRGGWWQAHPFSLSASPDGGGLRITVKAAGDHTHRLQAIPLGTRVVAEGPYGAFTAGRRRHQKVLLLAGGVGIAPLRALFEALPGAAGDLVLVYRARSARDLALRAELDDLAARRGARVYYAVGRRPPGARWPTPEALRSIIGSDLAGFDVYVCGPHGFMAACREALRAAGVPRRQIHAEAFSL